MVKPESEHIRDAVAHPLNARLDLVEVFSEIESTNSYLLDQAAPAPGNCRIALADHQTAGRGRLDNVWQSPADAGLYLSASYSFGKAVDALSCLTLAAGVAVADALAGIGAQDIRLKWPNDLIFLNGKLGGILTELKPGPGQVSTVVVGIGLNLDVGDKLDNVDAGIGKIAELREVLRESPDRRRVAVVVIERLVEAFTVFEQSGFAAFRERWCDLDWLRGKQISVETPGVRVQGVASGIDGDGALLIQGNDQRHRIISGSVAIQSTDAPIR